MQQWKRTVCCEFVEIFTFWITRDIPIMIELTNTKYCKMSQNDNFVHFYEDAFIA